MLRPRAPTVTAMRDLETIGADLRLVARAWRVAREMNCAPSTVHIDQLLDERRLLSRLECYDH